MIIKQLIELNNMQDNQSPKYFLVLPTHILPAALSKKEQQFLPQFLVGYRNILLQNGQSFEWGLTKSPGFCGKAFVYPLTQTEALEIQKIKNEGQYLQTVGTTYVLLKKESEVIKPSNKITKQIIEKLLLSLGGVNQINLNIFKSSFDSYEQYSKLVGQEDQHIDLGQKQTTLSVTQKVQIQFHAKRFSGKALLDVPKISNETGNWHQDQTNHLKLIDN